MVGLRALVPLHVDAVVAFAEIYASQVVAMPATCPIDRTLRPAIVTQAVKRGSRIMDPFRRRWFPGGRLLGSGHDGRDLRCPITWIGRGKMSW